MGKALIFSGVTVDSPLQTVTFIKELITASDYVNEYAKIATEVTSEQKDYLNTFVDTLISNGIWDKVRCCFPMLGGLNGYNKDLKDVLNQREWNTPEVGTSWDSTRNAPYLNLPGNAIGTVITIENMDKNNSAFLFSCKLKTKTSGGMISNTYATKEETDTILAKLAGNNGGWACPSWGTEAVNESLSGYNYGANASNIYIANMSNGTNQLFVCSNSSELLTWKTGTTTAVETTNAKFSIGSKYAAEMEAPATNTLNGCINMFIAFGSSLTEEEMRIVSKAVWDFDESCGRHIDFV